MSKLDNVEQREYRCLKNINHDVHPKVKPYTYYAGKLYSGKIYTEGMVTLIDEFDRAIAWGFNHPTFKENFREW